MHYYQFNIGDYASHTRHLGLMEDLAYRRILDSYYLTERPLNGSPADVAREIGMIDHVEAVKFVLSKFFVETTENQWENDRCEREIQHFKDKQQQASNAGKASAQRRLNGRSTDVQPTNNQEPITKNQLENRSPKGSHLPADWKPSEEDLAYCKQTRPDLDPDRVAEDFTDYWHGVAGQKGVKLDWPATWRGWIRKQFANKVGMQQLTVPAKEAPLAVQVSDDHIKRATPMPESLKSLKQRMRA